MEVICKKCGYIWRYTGNKKRISCSKCKTSITIHTPPLPVRLKKEAQQDVTEVISLPTGQPKELKDVKFPLALWRDVRLRQRIDHAPSLGDDHIVLKVDKDGILYL